MLILIIGLLIGSVSVESAKCRALALGGGTDYGAYEAGAIMGLIESLPQGEAEWDVVTGVGVGATNALIVSMYEKGQEASASTKLNSFWSNFSYETFYQDWIGGYVTGLLLKSGLYDSSPMKKALSSLQTGSFQRVLGVGATDLISANYVYFGSDQQSPSAMTTGIYASVSDYVFFPIVKYNDYQLLSGNIIYSADLIHAVTSCQNKGAALSEIYIDVVMGSGKTITPVDASHYNSIQALMRYLEIDSYASTMKSITNAKHEYKGINIRTTIYPSQKLDNPIYPYNFDHTQIQNQINLGIQDGKNAGGSITNSFS